MKFFFFTGRLQYQNMKLNIVVLLQVLLVLAVSIPYRDQIALLNSLEVGRKEEPMEWQCTGCDQNTRPLESYIIQENVKAVKAILSVYNEYSVLAFRYTANVKNVFQDLLWAIQVQDQHACKGCKVQKQYDNMWNSISEPTVAKLKSLPHTKRLIITGISLGGGLALLSYVDIVKAKIFDNIEVITFGCPRVGNKKWAAWFDEQTPSTRYFIKKDPIAGLPICLTLICNYEQVGTRVRCDKNNQLCSQLSAGQEEQTYDFGSPSEHLQALMEAVEEHQEDKDEHYGGIIDHIFGYKNLKEYDYLE